MVSQTRVLCYIEVCLLVLQINFVQGWHGRANSVESSCGRARKCWNENDCDKNFCCVKTGTDGTSRGTCMPSNSDVCEKQTLPCGRECNDENFCCLEALKQCRFRPRLGQACGSSTCPCVTGLKCSPLSGVCREDI
ncbi:hypothetical protein V1264_023267 [Littorina saxatilis]|uniref:Uncharacterized protein n=1 Tax=Littorina saxatilis TaxID=31220 RepID=A0AAN9B7M7_9CAEN